MVWNNLFQSNSAVLSQESGLWCPSRSDPTFLEDPGRRRHTVVRVRREGQGGAGCSL